MWQYLAGNGAIRVGKVARDLEHKRRWVERIPVGSDSIPDGYATV